MLSNQNKQATVILDQTNQLLSSMDQAYSFLNQKINDLKIAQD
jgi:hypothetical protein